MKGFEHRPALGIPYNRDYYAKLIEDAGFIGKGDILSGYLSPETMNAEVWDRIDRLSELIQKRRGLRVSSFTSRGDMRKAVPQLLALYNGALGQSEGNVPFTPDEAKAMADQLIWFADPRLIKIVYKGDEPVGFLLAYPDISAAVKKTQGRLFPFGWITLLRALRKSDWVNVNGAGLAGRASRRWRHGRAVQRDAQKRRGRRLCACRPGADRRGQRQNAARIARSWASTSIKRTGCMSENWTSDEDAFWRLRRYD